MWEGCGDVGCVRWCGDRDIEREDGRGGGGVRFLSITFLPCDVITISD